MVIADVGNTEAAINTEAARMALGGGEMRKVVLNLAWGRWQEICSAKGHAAGTEKAFHKVFTDLVREEGPKRLQRVCAANGSPAAHWVERKMKKLKGLGLGKWSQGKEGKG